MQVQPIKQTDIEIQGTTWLIADNSPLETCPICKVDIGCLNVCVEGHTLCEICFKDLQERNVLKCQKCPSKLFTEAEATNAQDFSPEPSVTPNSAVPLMVVIGRVIIDIWNPIKMNALSKN